MDNKRILRHLLVSEVFENYNRLIYWFQKIPLLGRAIPNSLFALREVKWFLFVSQLFLAIFNYFLKKIIYLLFVSLWGLFLYHQLPKFIGQAPKSVFLADLTAMIVLSIFLVTSVSLKLISRTDMDLAKAVRIFRISPKDYFVTQELVTFIRELVVGGIVFGVFLSLNGYSWLKGLAFLILQLGLRLFLKMAALPLYQNQKADKEKPLNHLMLASFMIAVTLSVLIIFLGAQFSPLLFFSWPAAFIGLVLWLFSFYQLKNAAALDGLTRSLVTHQAMKEQEIVFENLEVQSVTLKEKDIDVSKGKQGMDCLVGISYLNALFMQRMGKYLRKGIRVRLVVIAVLFLVVMLVFHLPALQSFQEHLLLKSKDSTRFLFVSVISGYFIYIGESYMKFCFYHLDRPLLKFNYYRQPDIIKAILKTRFVTSLVHNFPIFIAMNSFCIGLYFELFTWEWQHVILIILGQLVSMVFFSLYFLYLYFLLQPFTEGMKSNSLLYSILNGLCYFGSYQALRLTSVITEIMMLGLILAMIVILVSGYFAVLQFAPKTFKLKS